MTHLIYLDPLLFQPGDRMSLEEFLQRWEQMPDLKLAELIDGVVYMPSPVSPLHGRRDNIFELILTLYALRTPCCECLPSGTGRMRDVAPHPDLGSYVYPDDAGRGERNRRFARAPPE